MILGLTRMYKWMLVLWLALPSAALADDGKSQIHWLTIDNPPVGIETGAYRSRGIYGGIIAILGQELPDVSIDYGTINMVRLFATIRTGNFCVPGIIKTAERQKFLHFTRMPTAKILGSRLFFKKDNPRIVPDEHGQASLRALLRNGLSVGLGDGVAYGIEAKEILQDPDFRSQIYNHHEPDFVGPVLAMIDAGRLDMTMVPPWIVSWNALLAQTEESRRVYEDLAMLPLREMEESFLYYAACTKNNWELEVVTRLDSILRKADIRQRLDRNSEKWMHVGEKPEQ